MDGEGNGDYQQRVGHIFDRLQALNRNSEEDKTSKYRQALNLIGKFQNTMAEVQHENVQCIEQTTIRLEEVSKAVREQKTRLIADQQALQSTIKKVDASVRQTLNRYEKQMQIAEKALREKIRLHLIKLNDQSIKSSKQNAELLTEYKTLVDVTGPEIMKQIRMQRSVREQIQNKILIQFQGQINDLKEMIKTETKCREAEEEELIQLIRETGIQVQSLFRKEIQAKKESEHSLTRLLETVVNKIKYQILEDVR